MESPQTLTRQEVTQLLDYLQQDRSGKYNWHNRHRDHAIAVVMLETGLRVGELAQLITADLLFQGEPVHTLTVRKDIAKNHKERPIPISPTLHEEIKLCRQQLWNWHENQTQSFCWYRSDSRTHLTTRSIEAIIRTAALNSIGRPIHPHMLRHTFATNMMRVTSARIVQELLGHEDLRSTQIYCHPNGDDLAAAIRAKDTQERNCST